MSEGISSPNPPPFHQGHKVLRVLTFKPNTFSRFPGFWRRRWPVRRQAVAISVPRRVDMDRNPAPHTPLDSDARSPAHPSAAVRCVHLLRGGSGIQQRDFPFFTQDCPSRPPSGLAVNRHPPVAGGECPKFCA